MRQEAVLGVINRVSRHVNAGLQQAAADLHLRAVSESSYQFENEKVRENQSEDMLTKRMSTTPQS